MSIIVGVSPDESGADAVALGAVLSRCLGEELVLVHVHPQTFDYPSVGKVDAEWSAFLRERSEAILDAADQRVETEWGMRAAHTVVVANSSVGRGLMEAADVHHGSWVVLGPGSSGREAHVSLGSVAHSLVHGGHVGVALAPEGYRETAPDEVRRIVVAFQDDDNSPRLVQWTSAFAQARSLSVLLLSVVLRATRIVGARIGRDPERAVLDALVETQEKAQEVVLSHLDVPATGVVVQGDTAEMAMGRVPWHDGDLLLLGSSRFGALSRVLLGDTGLRILRAATVPALVLPRYSLDKT